MGSGRSRAWEFLESRHLLAVSMPLEPYLVKDLAPGAGAGFDTVHVTIGDRFFALASSPDSGVELWTSDGTASGTHIVCDIYPGPASSTPKALLDVNGTLYFTADDGVHGRELWRHDPTSGTELVADLSPGQASSDFSGLSEMAGDLYFVTGGSEKVLWRIGSAQPELTRVFAWAPAGMFWVGAANNALFFTIGESLWTSDGTTTGTQALKEVSISSTFDAAGGLFFFMGNDGVHGDELWRSDGTADGTFMVKDIGPQASSGIAVFARAVSMGGRLYFPATDGVHGTELWVSDGTEVGTSMVVDLLPGASGSMAGHPTLTALGERLLFTTTTGVSQLWSTDGSTIGTHLVGQLPSWSGPFHVESTSEQAFFVPYWGGMVYQTEGSTVRVVELPSQITRFAAADNVVYLALAGSEKLATLDPATGELQELGVMPGRPAAGSPSPLVEHDGIVYFLSARQLWRSDGTTSGTYVVLDDDASFLRSLGGALYFERWAGDAYQLWSSDGTGEGTQLIQEFPRSYSHTGWWGAVAGGPVYFAVGTPSGTTELWRTNGTTEGTSLVREIPGAEARDLVEFDGRLFFVASDPEHGAELWVSDGTAEGTHVFADLYPGPASPSPAMLRTAGDWLFFTVGNGVWRTDGTPERTELVTAFGSPNFMTACGDWMLIGSDSSVYRIDPTTGIAHLVSQSGALLAIGVTPDKAILIGSEKVWVTGGTLETTTPLGDWKMVIWTADRMASVNGRAFFVADDGLHGLELWTTDGTVDGTRRVADIWPGVEGANPSDLSLAGHRLFFAANDGMHGRELWALDTTADMEVTGTGEADAIIIGIVGDLLRVIVNDAATEYPLSSVSSLIIHGLGGNDLITVDSSVTRAITIYGGAGDDTITGGAGANMIYAGEGNDRIKGRNSADTIYGEGGNDWIAGMDGADQIDGGAGMDRIYGGIAADVVAGGDDSDTIYGGAGADVIDAGAGDDIVLGENDADSVLGGDGNDTLRGNFGADTIDGGFGGDQLLGDLDDDELHGGSGTDLLNGGPGDDLLYGEGHRDRLIGADGHDQLWGGTDYDSLYGGLGNDTLNGDDGDDLLYGGMNNDSLTGGRGRDTLLGESGDDHLYSYGDSTRDLLRAGEGVDSTEADSLDALLDVSETIVIW